MAAGDTKPIIMSNEKDPEDVRPNINNLLSLLPKFELKFPPFFRLPKPDHHISANDEEEPKQISTRREPDAVRFAEPKPITPPPLKLEVEEKSGLSDPLIIYPVYALGGFFILNWIWARWKERKERAKKNDDNQSADEYQSPVEDEE